jgi:hypothetical protein
MSPETQWIEGSVLLCFVFFSSTITLKTHGHVETFTSPSGRTHKKTKDLSVCERKERGYGESDRGWVCVYYSDGVTL